MEYYTVFYRSNSLHLTKQTVSHQSLRCDKLIHDEKAANLLVTLDYVLVLLVLCISENLWTGEIYWMCRQY